MENEEILNAERILRNLERGQAKLDAATAREKKEDRDETLFSILIWGLLILGLVGSVVMIVMLGPIVLPFVLIVWFMVIAMFGV